VENNNLLNDQKNDLKEIILLLFFYKKIFIITIISFLLIAFTYNKITTPRYKNELYLLIGENNSNAFLGSKDLSEGFGFFGEKKNVENELGILGSYTLVYNTVRRLNMDISYYQRKDFIPIVIFDFAPFSIYRETYKETPFIVVPNSISPRPIGLNFYITVLSSDKFRIAARGENLSLFNSTGNEFIRKVGEIEIDKVYRFGEEIVSGNFNFKIVVNNNFFVNNFINKTFYFVFNNINEVAQYYQTALDVRTSTPNSSLVRVSVVGGNYEEVTDFLNEYSEVYIERNLQKKNNVANSTIDFINSQLSDVSDSLRKAENKLQNFRTSNQVMNLSLQGEQFLRNLNDLESQKAILDTKARYYNSIKEYIENNKKISDLVTPVGSELDPILNGLINSLIQLSGDRVSLLNNNNNPENIQPSATDIKINNLKSTILENANYYIKTLNNSIGDLNDRIEELNRDILKLPRTERELFGIERKTKLNDAIYAFLLEKRSEAQIAKASNIPDYEVIDKARVIGKGIVSPKKSLNYALALLLGILLPALVIVSRKTLSWKITDLRDVNLISDYPVLGQIIHNNKKSINIIQDFPKSRISESFRSVRTNLSFFLQGKDNQIVLITSTMSGEGKSFFASHLATVLSYYDKKVLLIGFDLRKPALFSQFGNTDLLGMSSYLIRSANFEDIVQKTEIQNLEFIPAGPIPPNPSELIASERTQEFLELAREMYDFIIIDTPPIGAVTDAFLMMKQVDLNIFLIRMNYTNKDALRNSVRALKNSNIQNISTIINDIESDEKTYRYKYYDEKKKNPEG
jgi:tyrosine-protein kinase Etk/Wzc